MKYSSVLSPGAKADLRSVVRWYHHIDRNLALRFKHEALATLRRIMKFPYQFPIVDGKSRRALLKHFPYSIVFALKKDGPFVIAVVHQRRSDRIWMDRATHTSEREPL